MKRLDARSEEQAVYQVLDALTDSFFPVIGELDDTIDTLMIEMAERHTPGQRERLFALRRRIVELRKVVGPMRDVFTAAGGTIRTLPGLDVDAAHDYFRDVYDHLLRISEGLDSLRELLSGALDVYLSTQSNKLNTVTYRLTVVATIFLPLTFVTGFFGQNFGWLVDHISSGKAFLIWSVGGTVFSLLALGAWLRRSALRQ
jgi:magnesium transporter